MWDDDWRVAYNTENKAYCLDLGYYKKTKVVTWEPPQQSGGEYPIPLDVGIWAAAAPIGGQLPLGDRLLLGQVDERSIGPGGTAAVVAAAAGPPAPPWAAAVRQQEDVLSGTQCTELVSRADAAFAAACVVGAPPPADLKIDLTFEELQGVIGAAPLAQLVSLGVAVLQPHQQQLAPRFLLRRRSAPPGSARERIPFHRDHSIAVSSIALGAGFDGGRLLFAGPDGVSCPSRPCGSAIAHNNAAVHGVSALTSGVRYNLFAIFEAVVAPAA
jgi:hypothetical protein